MTGSVSYPQRVRCSMSTDVDELGPVDWIEMHVRGRFADDGLNGLGRRHSS
jgi:hypothetical protein